MSIIDALVEDLKARGISVDNHNPIVETKCNLSKFKYSRVYKKKYLKPTCKPLAKL